MLSIQKDSNTRLKLAQLWHVAHDRERRCSKRDVFKRIVNDILMDDVNINCKVTIDSSIPEEHKIHLKNCTALHFVYYGPVNIHAFTSLLERGADFTIKNNNGQTALHLIMTNWHDNFIGIKKDKRPFINAVISAHVKLQMSTNPRDNNNLSHFHAACIANNVEALELFLQNGATIHDTVDMNAQKFAGYTPLHFAAKYQSVKVAKILLSRGADVNARNAKGMTPLDISIENRSEKSDKICYQPTGDDDDAKTYQIEMLDIQKIIELLFEKHSFPTLGLSKFHIACTLNNLTTAEKLLDEITDINQVISMESPLCPGDTALHFAADTSLETVKMLLLHGAKLDIENAIGLSPLDLCVNKYSIEEICNVLSCDKNWNSLYMTDGKTKLLDLIRAMADLDKFKLFLEKNSIDLAVPSDSLILPGYTILHLAVIFSIRGSWYSRGNEAIVKECLKKGLNVNTQNNKGQTPIHLALRLGKHNITETLLQHLNTHDEVTDFMDDDNLSYLHIISCVNNLDLQHRESLVAKLLKTGSPNVTYKGKSILRQTIVTGTTALHTAVDYKFFNIVAMLLRHGADLHATDINGITPIHCLLRTSCPQLYMERAQIVFKSLLENPKDVVVDGIGLSYLHIACYVGNLETVKKLLDLGSSVNAVISYENFDKRQIRRRHVSGKLLDIVRFATFTPFHLSQFIHNKEIVLLLLYRGADPFAKVLDRFNRFSDLPNSQIINIPLEDKDLIHKFMSMLLDQDEMQKDLEERWGLTKLHIACHTKNEEAIKIALNEGADINGQIKPNSEIFAGCTPLHLLLTVSNCQVYRNFNEPRIDIGSMITLLLDRGADVTIANDKKNTPIHLVSRSGNYMSLLLDAHQDFSVNPVNSKGISHFHLACHWRKVNVVEKFLLYGSVNVNQPINCFIDTADRAGCTPLHLVLNKWMWPHSNWTNVYRLVDLLLEHGADVTAKDARGNTALHEHAVLNSPALIIIDKFLRYGVDINVQDVEGRTTLGDWTNFEGADYTTLVEKYDYQVNNWNRLTGEGYIGHLFVLPLDNTGDNTQFQKVTQSSAIRLVDKKGRTAIHNSVAVLRNRYFNVHVANYVYVIQRFIELGLDIDYQDQSGQTALHYAAKMENTCGIEGLLKHGIDINIIDGSGKLSFSYILEYRNRDFKLTNSKYMTYEFEKMIEVCNLHVKKLQYLKLEVDPLNIDIFTRLQSHRNEESDIWEQFINQVEETKTLKVGIGSLTLFNFLCETGMLTDYLYLPIFEQTTIDNFFKSINPEQFSGLIGIIRLQFRKMKARFELIEPAIASLRKLLGFSVPGLCEEIARFLPNFDLKNLIFLHK